MHKRLLTQFQTISLMTAIYCNAHHNTKKEAICDECKDFTKYVFKRLAKCPYKEKKTTCEKCPIHCYQDDMKIMAKEIMRYSGPKMIYKHPILALLHVLNKYRRVM